MEVNSSPGLEGIEGATSLDIAGEIVDYIGDQVNFPDLDIRQRLSVSRGYNVAELSIPAGSELIGKTIQDSGLRDRDIVVLTLHRDTAVIPNPKVTRDFQAGDRLLCFGKQSEMKAMIPDRTGRRKKRKPQYRDPDGATS